jgi:rubrerythrin
MSSECPDCGRASCDVSVRPAQYSVEEKLICARITIERLREQYAFLANDRDLLREVLEEERSAYQRGWNDGAAAHDPETDPALIAMKREHALRWWGASHAQRIADMAEYAAAKAEKLNTPAAKTVAETLSHAQKASSAIQRLVESVAVVCCPKCGLRVSVKESDGERRLEPHFKGCTLNGAPLWAAFDLPPVSDKPASEVP